MYDNLNQFNNLTAIEIIRKTDDGVQVLEHIVEACRSLRNIDLTLFSMNYQHDYVQVKKNFDLDTKTHYAPRYNIKTLNIRLSMAPIDNFKVLLYIMNKLPNLEELYMARNGKNVQVTPYFLAQLLNYLDTIKEGDFSNLTASPDNIYKTLGNFWNTTSKPGVENVKFNYSDDRNDFTIETQFTFHIDKDPVTKNQVILYCSFQVFDRPAHMDFIEKNGKFIDDLTFEFDDNLSDTPENFWIHIFKFCPNLRNLRINFFTLSECTHLNFDKINRYSLDKLTPKDCNITPGILEQLSTGLLSEVKQLRLIDTRYHNDGVKDDISRINMPQTIIQRIALGSIRDKYRIYVKLFVVTDQKHYYYQSDPNIDSIIASTESRTKNSEQIDKKIYDEGNGEECKKFFVCCQTKPEIICEYYDIDG